MRAAFAIGLVLLLALFAAPAVRAETDNARAVRDHSPM